MKIRTRLSLNFTLISSCLLFIFLVSVYYLFAVTSREDFYHRIDERIGFASGVYLEADEISESTLQNLKKKFIVTLPQEEIRFYDSHNKSAFIEGSKFDWPTEIIEQVRHTGHIQYKSGQQQVVGETYSDNQGDYVILASAVDVTGNSRKMMLIKIMATLFGLQIFIQFLAGRWFATRILDPIQQVNNKVQTITATDLHLRLDEGEGNDEFSLLAHNFNKLLERIEGAFETHKMFIANASHELKTPLTGIMGEIEVALSKDRANEDYRHTLQSILSESERLHVIVENLLLLAYEENNNSPTDHSPVRIDDLLWEIQEQFEREGNHILHISMNDLPEDEERITIQGNKTLLMLALTNIVRNAFKYSQGKDVNVLLRADSGSLSIKVVDQGIGISEQAMKNIFEPFYRTKSAERYEGSGIGLYIAYRIVTFFKGRIEVESTINKGSIFTIIFPTETAF
jgi:signal transduction histidine kinase